MFFNVPFQPSHRALDAAHRDLACELHQKFRGRSRYHAVERPNGLIDLSGATNSLMSDWFDRYTAAQPSLNASQLMDCPSPSGSEDLLNAAAGFFNDFFHPSHSVSPSEILAGNGATTLLDLLLWASCDRGDAVLVMTPTFSMPDMNLRADITTIPVSTAHISDPFDPSAVSDLIRALDAATDGAARRRGVRCRALFICNPAALQGRCYTLKTLAELAAWCSRREMHLIANEVYALSAFGPGSQNRAMASVSDPGQHAPSTTGFTSILSLPYVGGRPPQNVHCLYSLSKDFGMKGLRMGFLVTRNSSIHAAALKASWSTCPTHFSDLFATGLLCQRDLLAGYLVKYRQRLTSAYLTAGGALRRLEIPFALAYAGLFIFVDLSQWLKYFPEQEDDLWSPTPELRLCEWLINHGVFLNPGQYSGYEVSGHFRLLFTGDSGATMLGIQRLRAALDKLGASSRG